MSKWKLIKSAPKKDRLEVDVWLQVYASPRSMGWSDAFRVTNAYQVNGKWFHLHEGKEAELYSDYITHWMSLPKPPTQGQREDG